MKAFVGLFVVVHVIILMACCIKECSVLHAKDEELMRLESEGIRRDLANEVLLEYLKGGQVEVKPSMLNVAWEPLVAAYHEKVSE